jgi:hypothetical protein
MDPSPWYPGAHKHSCWLELSAADTACVGQAYWTPESHQLFATQALHWAEFS